MGAVEPVPGEARDGCSGEQLRRLLADHTPRDERERASKERFLRELGRLSRPCDQDADPVHVTASGVVVGRRGTVLHVHRRLHRWMQPGGHVDAGERPSQAALREACEETGLPLSHPSGGARLFHVDVHDAAQGHVHLDLRYLLVGGDDDPAPPPGESPEARWFSWAEAEGVADEALVGALHLARAAWVTGDVAPEPAAGTGGTTTEAAGAAPAHSGEELGESGAETGRSAL